MILKSEAAQPDYTASRMPALITVERYKLAAIRSMQLVRPAVERPNAIIHAPQCAVVIEVGRC